MTGHEVVPRLNGPTYRARKAPAAELLSADWDDVQVIVWRTQDVDVAVPLAARAWRRELDGPLPGSVLVGWFRSVPWDTGAGGDWSVIDAGPNERGATPGVLFREPTRWELQRLRESGDRL